MRQGRLVVIVALRATLSFVLALWLHGAGRAWVGGSRCDWQRREAESWAGAGRWTLRAAGGEHDGVLGRAAALLASASSLPCAAPSRLRPRGARDAIGAASWALLTTLGGLAVAWASPFAPGALVWAPFAAAVDPGSWIAPLCVALALRLAVGRQPGGGDEGGKGGAVRPPCREARVGSRSHLRRLGAVSFALAAAMVSGEEAVYLPVVVAGAFRIGARDEGAKGGREPLSGGRGGRGEEASAESLGAPGGDAPGAEGLNALGRDAQSAEGLCASEGDAPGAEGLCAWEGGAPGAEGPGTSEGDAPGAEDPDACRGGAAGRGSLSFGFHPSAVQPPFPDRRSASLFLAAPLLALIAAALSLPASAPIRRAPSLGIAWYLDVQLPRAFRVVWALSRALFPPTVAAAGAALLPPRQAAGLAGAVRALAGRHVSIADVLCSVQNVVGATTESSGSGAETQTAGKERVSGRSRASLALVPLLLACGSLAAGGFRTWALEGRANANHPFFFAAPWAAVWGAAVVAMT